MAMTATTYTYQRLQPFTSKEQLNANTIAIRKQFRHLMKPSTKKVLDFLHRHACKFYGVCYMSKNKIAKKLGVHRTTVIRACEQLEEFGAIVQYETKRATGDKRQSTNAIVFVHQVVAREAFIERATPECDTIDTPQETPKILNNTDDTREPSKEEMLKKALKDKIPVPLANVLSPFFNADEMYDIVGTIYKAKSTVDSSVRIEDHGQVYYKEILSIIQAWGKGRIHSLHGTIFNKTKQITRTIVAKERMKQRWSWLLEKEGYSI